MTPSSDKPDRIDVGEYVFQRQGSIWFWVKTPGAYLECTKETVALIDELLAARAEIARITAPPVVTITHDNAARYVDPYESVRADERARIRALLEHRLTAQRVDSGTMMIAQIKRAIDAACGPAPAPDPRREELAAWLEQFVTVAPISAGAKERLLEAATLLRGGR